MDHFELSSGADSTFLKCKTIPRAKQKILVVCVYPWEIQIVSARTKMAESDADFQGDANQDLLNPLLTSVNVSFKMPFLLV